jgi:ElaB/YqjD/DUF883 family membrane-anchored ribosome-binding protein
MAEDSTAKPAGTKTAKPRKPRASAATGAAKPESRQRFAKALEEAKAGAEALSKEARERAEALGKEAKDRAGAYRAKAAGASSEWAEEAGKIGAQAKDKAYEIASDGKAKASEAIAGLGQLVEENAAVIDEKVGPKYGDYARTAARSMKDAAEKLDAKDVGELGEDAKEFVRKSPGAAMAIAAAAGFVIARLFGRSGR